MIAEGALDEARSNLETWEPRWQSSQAIGAPELIAHLQGQISLDEAKTRAVTASSQFASQEGALDEARSNLETWEPRWQSSQAIGAPELIAHLQGQISLDEAKTLL
jgi:tRNA dimethylallyltransferase